MKDIYFAEVGVLLSEEHAEYEWYSNVYDRKHGYYDEGWEISFHKEYLIEKIKTYCCNGVNNTYGVIVVATVEDDFVLEDDMTWHDIGGDYDIQGVVYSVYKNENGKLIEDFVKK